MKRNTLSYASCIATAAHNTYSLHSAMILTHTIASSQKQNTVIPEMMPEANSPHSRLFLGREHGGG